MSARAAAAAVATAVATAVGGGGRRGTQYIAAAAIGEIFQAAHFGRSFHKAYENYMRFRNSKLSTGASTFYSAKSRQDRWGFLTIIK